MRVHEIANLNSQTRSESAPGILRLNEIEKVIPIKSLKAGNSVKKLKLVLSVGYFVVLTISLIKLLG